MHRLQLTRALLLIPLLFPACVGSSVYISPLDRSTETAPPPTENRAYQVFLIGDAGGSFTIDSEPALRLLKNLTTEADSNSTVVFLGDNIYCCGMPDSSSTRRAWAEMRIMAQIEAVRAFPGRVVFIPGNHDWGGSFGARPESVRQQQAFVESELGDDEVFMPDDGLPGPIELKLKDGLRLIAVDTQWWMTEADKPYGESGSAEIGEDADFLFELEDLITRRRDDDLLIVGHHPVLSNSTHGGHFPLTDHLFPLTAVMDGLYIPLPVIGSLYPLVRSLAGGQQDFSNVRYGAYRSALKAMFEDHEGRIVYASGHDHNLQYFSEGHVHHLISGSGSSSDYVAPGNGARFASREEGLLRLSFYENGEIWLEALAAVADSPNGQVIYRSQMEGPRPEAFSDTVAADVTESIQIAVDGTVTTAAGPSLDGGRLHRFLFGSEHRDAWIREVTFPVFDIGKEAGGLKPIKRGGSLQTTSIRLENEAGLQFVLRSVMKDPTRSLPTGLEKTLASDIAIDQIAIMHPYAAPVAARLANAVGVYHANPRYVVVPDDPRFGPYRDIVANRLMLFEERPNDDMSHAPSFGRSEDVIGTVDMVRKITDDNDDRVDERQFAKSRLFDMYLSDWDRHSDQWRWASYSADGYDGTVFQAIPRDRDWAFSRMNGLFPSIAKLPFIIPKFQDFREGYGYLPGLNLTGMAQDRRFTSSLDLEDWIAIAEELQTSLTDEEIDRALTTFPEPIRAIYEEEYQRLLRVRRDALDEVARRYYRIIARLADVVGSNKHERFEVTRLDEGRTEVVVYKTSKDGEVRREIFRRVFLISETKEIRLYGLDGNDSFLFEGEVHSAIPIRAIGGAGNDTFVDNSNAAGDHNSIKIYDIPGNTNVDAGPSTDVRISDDPLVNRYDPNEYGLTHFMPALYPGANQDDGFFVGGGGTFTLYGFRKLPFDSRHTFRGNVSTRTGAFNLLYKGRFIDRLDGWDIGLAASAKTPNNIRNFFGLGNESANTEANAEFYQARFSSFAASLAMIKPIKGIFEFSLGPTFEYTDIRRDSLRFVGQPQAGISATSFNDQTYAGIASTVTIDGRDSEVYPRQGIRWQSGVHVRIGLQEASANFTQIQSDFSLYATPARLKRVTLAFRAGVHHNFGDFPFFLASTLGGEANLRGWRSTRFAGRSAMYQNVEMRIELFRYATLLAAGTAGILGFLDNGRIMTDGEHSRTWHQGYGVGFWMNLFDLTVFSGSVGFSEEETALTIGIGLFF